MTTPITTPAELEELESLASEAVMIASAGLDVAPETRMARGVLKLYTAVRALQAERKCPVHDTAWGSHCINLPLCPSPSDGGDGASEELQAHDSLLHDGDL